MDRYYQFEANLIAELEACIKSPFQKTPLEVWNPRKTATPERHVQLGLLSGHSLNQIKTLLETQNSTFNDIESLLGIQYNFKENTLHPISEQVWLWGATTLSKYLQLLTMPGAIRSEFYCVNHDRLIELLRKACSEQPNQRPSFVQLLTIWSGRKPITSEDVISEDSSLSSDDGPSMTSPPQIHDDDASVLQPSSLSSRLVLSVRPTNVERNKTRKSLRN